MGKFLQQQVVYPDYRNGLIADFLEDVKSLLDDSVGLGNIDGFSLVKNWPYNEVVQEIDPEDFPYLPEVSIKNAFFRLILVGIL